MKRFSAKKSQKYNFCSPVLWVLFIAVFLFLTGCSAKNNTIKNDLKKKIAYSLNQANKYFSSMQLEKAIRTYNETLELCYMLDDLETEVIVYVKLSSVYLVLGKEEETYFYLLKARAILALYEEQLSYYPVYLFYSGQADYFLYQKDFGQCFDFYEKSLALAETQKEKSYILNRIGRAYIVKGSPDKALDYINQSLKINQSKKIL